MFAQLLSITAIAILVIIIAHTYFVSTGQIDDKLVIRGFKLPTLEFSNKDEEIPHDDVAESKEDLAKDSLTASDDESKSLFYSLFKGSGSNLQDEFVHDSGPSAPLPQPYTQNNSKFVQIAKNAPKIEDELDEDAFKRQTTVVPATVELRRDVRRPYDRTRYSRFMDMIMDDRRDDGRREEMRSRHHNGRRHDEDERGFLERILGRENKKQVKKPATSAPTFVVELNAPTYEQPKHKKN